MKREPNLSRRTVVAGQVALAAAAALPVTANATASALGSAAQPVSSPPRWETATADDLQQFVGQRFQVQTAEHGSVVLRLKSVEPVQSGSARPSDLARTEGLSAIFESPDQDVLVGLGHQIHTVRHARLGSTELFMGPVPTLGGAVIEVVLN